jgi:hypothetical protein
VASNGEEGLPFSPEPITVQGITVRPGDEIVVVEYGKSARRRYSGVGTDGYVWFEMDLPLCSLYECRRGPFDQDQLRHPDLLTAIIREIDAAE